MKLTWKSKTPIGFLSVVGVGLLAYEAVIWSTGSSVNHELELARKEGIPITPADFQGLDPFPPSENSIEEYRPLEPQVKAMEQKLGQLFVNGPKKRPFDDPAFRSRVAAVFAENKVLVDKLEKLAYRPVDRQAVSQSAHLDGPYLTGEFLSTRAQLDNYEPSGQAAIRDLETAVAASDPERRRLASNDLQPMYVNHGLAQIVARHASEPDTLEAAERILTTTYAPRSYVRSMAENLRGPRKELAELNFDGSSDSGHLQFAADHPIGRLSAVRAMWDDDLIRFTRKEFAIVGTKPLSLEEAINRFETVEDTLNEGNVFRATFANIFQPRTHLTDYLVLDLTHSRLLRQYIAILQARNKTGKFPTKLPLGGPAAIDPFTNDRQKYLVQKGGFVVYSLGPDGTDGHGAIGSHNIALRYPAESK